MHVDPAYGWFPHFRGFAQERGETNLNATLPPGSSGEALVVALGVDAASADPNSPLRVSEAGFREAGRRLGGLGLPAVLVQEGGYVLETAGPLVLEVLQGFEEGSP